jgi:hypothetical protein
MSLCELEFAGIVFVLLLSRFFLVLEDVGFALAVGRVVDPPLSVALSASELTAAAPRFVNPLAGLEASQARTFFAG